MYKPIKIFNELDKLNIIIQDDNSPKKTKTPSNVKKIVPKFKINKNSLKNVSLNILKNRNKNPNILNLSSNDETEFHLLKYRPKRLIKIRDQGNSKIPFTDIGGKSFELEKINKSAEKKIIDNNIINSNLSKNLTDNEKIANVNINNYNDSEFKSYFILKFAKNSEEFNKLKSLNELFNDEYNKRNYEDIFDKISKLIELQNKLYFKNLEYNPSINLNQSMNNSNNQIMPYNSLLPSVNKNTETTKNRTRNNSLQDIPSMLSTTLNLMNNFQNSTKYNSLNNTYITTLTSATPKNNKDFIHNMKILFQTWSEIVINFTKMLSNIMKELSLIKTENSNLKKKNIIDEIRLNKTDKEYNELKKYLNRFDINMRINTQISSENKINNLKSDFLKKENEYKLMIFKLENEIKSLTVLLDKNKIYYEQYKDLSNEINKNKKEKELLKIKYNKELYENKIQIMAEKDSKEELYLDIEKIKKELTKVKQEKNEEKKINIEIQSLIKKLKINITEKEENIIMLNEELTTFIRKYKEENYKYLNLFKDFKLLEKRFYENNKEKNNKEEDDNSNIKNDNGSVTPKFNKFNKSEDKSKSPSTSNLTQNNNSQI